MPAPSRPFSPEKATAAPSAAQTLPRRLVALLKMSDICANLRVVESGGRLAPADYRPADPPSDDQVELEIVKRVGQGHVEDAHDPVPLDGVTLELEDGP